MPPVNGVLTPSKLAQIVLKVQDMWTNSMIQNTMRPRISVLQAIIAQQTANVQILQDPDKDREVRIVWLDNCSASVESCADGSMCEFDGAEMGSAAQLYGINDCAVYKANINAEKYRTDAHSLDEAIATEMLKADKLLSEYIAAKVVAKLEASKGVNLLTANGFPVTGTTTTIPANDFKGSEVMGYFYRAADMNNFANPYIISGSNLRQENWVAATNQANADGKGDITRFTSMPIYFDEKNVDSLNSPLQKTYLVNGGSLAFATKARFGVVPVTLTHETQFSFASRNVQGMFIDVRLQNGCANNGDTLYKWIFTARFDLFLNPLPCVETNTGVLAFVKGS